jgi:hypothetical protein
VVPVNTAPLVRLKFTLFVRLTHLIFTPVLSTRAVYSTIKNS